MTKKTILGQGAWYLVYGAGERTYITTTFTFDRANQLVSSTTDGVTTKYAYDAAGRLVKEGNKQYKYGYLDKVLSVTDGKSKYTYDYHVDGQLARANYDGNGRAGCPQPAASEDFLWDGLALVQRGGEQFINEPHVGGGNPVVSSKGTSYFNDMLGTTLGAKGKYKRYSAAALTAFGEDISDASSCSPFPVPHSPFFTGKPYVAGLGHAFLFRNYRAGLAKWQTADSLGYPDGWNQLGYCGNGVTGAVDGFSLWTVQIGWTSEAGAASGVMQSLGITFGFSWTKGFSFGFYSTTGIGSYVGAGASTGVEFVFSNASSISELAGVGYEANVALNSEHGYSFSLTGAIPVNIQDTGFFSFGFSLNVSTPGIPVEFHSYITYTAIVEIFE